MTRRDFLKLLVAKCRLPAKIAIGLVVAAGIGWLALVAYEIISGVTLYGRLLLGCIAAVVALLHAVRMGARYVYARLPARPRAVCQALGHALTLLVCIAAGVMVVPLIQAGRTPRAVAILVITCSCAAKQGYDLYKRRISEQSPAADSTEAASEE